MASLREALSNNFSVTRQDNSNLVTIAQSSWNFHTKVTRSSIKKRVPTQKMNVEKECSIKSSTSRCESYFSRRWSDWKLLYQLF